MYLLCTRRRFLRGVTAAASTLVLPRTFGQLPVGHSDAIPYDGTLRDRLWMWGHDAGSLKGTYGFGNTGGQILPGDAIRYMGIPNVCMIPFTGTPLPPWDSYAKQFRDARRVTWSFVDGGRKITTEEKKRAALDLVPKMPNLVGLTMDDFFLGDAVPKTGGAEAAANLTVQQVRQIGKELAAQKRKLELSMTVYTNQLHPTSKPHLDEVDVVYLWTWHASDLANLEANYTAYRKLEPAKRTLLGIYMWDFGDKKPIPIEMMEHQCRLGLEWLQKGEIEGLIFHCTPLCDMRLEAVEWSRKWIADHADATIPA